MSPKINRKIFTTIFIIIVSSYSSSSTILINGGANSTLISPNGVFALGFFSLDGGPTSHLGIWYSSIPIRTYVWLANRHSPIQSPPQTLTLALTPTGHLAVISNSGTLWSTPNSVPASEVSLLDTGNLILTSAAGEIVWQSFDFPSDTWLPNMTVTNLKPLISWRSPSDPSPGLYSLRLRPPEFGEFELVYNGSVRYWSTGNWTGSRFAGVPEMTVPYIYSFRFLNPYTPDASFFYSETTAEAAAAAVLSRFVVDFSGRVVQFVWSEQAASWNVFWSRPESECRVYGRCGNLGFCRDGLWPCVCMDGLDPVNPNSWNSGDFSGGCANNVDDEDDNGRFVNVGSVDFDGARTVEIRGVSREACEQSCRSNSSCFGIKYDLEMNLCDNLYGNAFNMKNSTTASPVLYLRVSLSRYGSRKKGKWKKKIAILISSISAFLTMAIVLILLLLFMSKRRKRNQNASKELNPVTNLRVFTYKELTTATRNFSDKLGQGGFGTVFLGKLPDSTAIAVKRLERPNGGDREFRAEVRTIGSIQHVNLVRLRGFCSEGPHRLLVYDYMPNGPLSAYLANNRSEMLSWQSRFRIAVGTARGIAYLHDECRDCIIHCDIKPENILLDGCFTPKVSDFGLAKLIGREFSRVIATMRGTRGYVAPEWISGVAITTKADVYSYGMTLLEIIGGRRNVASVVGDEEVGWFFPPWAARRIAEGDVAAVVDTALGGEYDATEVERAGAVAVWCIQDEEGARPTMGEVVKMLEGTVAVAAPPPPKLLQALVSGDSFARAEIISTSVSGVGEDTGGL